MKKQPIRAFHILLSNALLLATAVGLSRPAAVEENSKLPRAAEIQVEFEQHIKPMLDNHCAICHGESQQMGGLRLDNRAAAMAGGYSGPVILPGNSAESRLIHLVAGVNKDIVMPMVGEKLTPHQVGLLRAWIDQGAVWPEPALVEAKDLRPGNEPASAVRDEPVSRRQSTHWAFSPPKRPPIPLVRTGVWVRNPIDNFILARLEKEGTQPSPEANRRTLIRRLNLDLIGLPPTLKDVEAFVMDNRADAYERLVDRLLASPHYGERWALPWMDAARYGDSDGVHDDEPRPYAWRYRDWVIGALNKNMPFDQFTIEQIAGDLLPNPTQEQLIATGFNRNTLTSREGGIDIEELRMEQVKDRASTVGSVWLGLTVACASCHDHKYDPISQKEFYELTAFFNSTEEVNIEAPLPGEIGPYLEGRPEYERKRAELLEQHNVAALQAEWEKGLLLAAENPGVRPDWDIAWDHVGRKLDNGYEIFRIPPSERTAKQQEDFTDHFLRWYGIVVDDERYEELKFRELREKLSELRKQYPRLTEAQTIAERPEARRTHILIRGDYRQPGVEVQPNTPSVLPSLPAHDGIPDRLTLARWLVAEDNPLTARVTVNRFFWQEIFGRGLVKTSEDFGTRSEMPSHPELLDWLATEFARDWNIKRILKLIVMSATYRQSSDVREDQRARDPENVLLAGAPRLRLPAELIRDSALAASGLLYPEVGGRSILPHQPDGVAARGRQYFSWDTTDGPERYKRGLYIFFRRSTPYPMLVTFDAPDRLHTCARREQSTTPLQSLVLLNDPVFFEAARALAVRILREEPGNVKDRLRHGFRLCLARNPSPGEERRLIEFYQEQKAILTVELDSAQQLFPAHGIEGVDAFEAATWVGVSRLLFNLDEFITKE